MGVRAHIINQQRPRRTNMNRTMRVLMAAIAAAITYLLLITEDPDTGASAVTNSYIILIICSMMFFIILRALKLVSDASRRDAVARRTVNKPY